MKSSTIGLGYLLLIFLSFSEAAKTSAKNGQSLKSWLRSMRPKRNENSLATDRIWTLADALPGEPGRDYPIFATAPETGFSCDDKRYGYYADIEARCQAFHICANTAGSQKGFVFLCPNGTLFNQRYFVCDWYMNVDCEGSEKYFNLNDLIGDSMDGLPHNDMMNTVKDIMSYTKQTSQPSKGGSPLSLSKPGDRTNGGDNNNRRTGTVGGRPTNGGPGSSSVNGNVPLRGSANLAQPTAGGSGHPGYTGSRQDVPPNFSGSPYASSTPQNRLQGGPQGLPQRGANGGTVYVNSLGQLSTDDGSGFDPKHSFILRPDKDSKFDQDTRIPSNSFDILKGIENSYSFGFPDDITTPLRGSADLSEPVDLSIFGSKNGPAGINGNRKQIYTYPPDSNGYQQSSIPPEQQGQLNTKLAAQGPKYPASQVYGPAVTQPGQHSHTQDEYPGSIRAPTSQAVPQAQYPSSSQRGSSQPTYPKSQNPSIQGGANYPKTNYPSSQTLDQKSHSPQNVPQRNQQNYQQNNGFNAPRGPTPQNIPQSQFANGQRIPQSQTNGQRGPSQSYSSPKNPFTQPQRFPSNQQTALGQRSDTPYTAIQNIPSTTSTFSNTPQKVYQQAYHPSNPTLNSFSSPQKLYQQPRQGPSNVPQSFNPIGNQQQTQRRQFNSQNPQTGHRNGQSNEEYLKIVLKDKNNVHDDKNQLIELIQRFFVPQNSQTKVVSADVTPSREQESYSFTYDGNGVSSNPRSSYQQPNHQHSNVCGHQGY